MNGTKNRKIVFVILHFMAVETTGKCIDYIEKNIDIENYQIVIVDNASPDSSYNTLQSWYMDNCKIDLIHSRENLGFTKGNNLGIKFALQNYTFDYMVVCNNDAFLIETAFVSKLDKYCKKYNYAVAGPRIINIYGDDANPAKENLPTINQINEAVKLAKKRILLDKFHLMIFFLKMKAVRGKLKELKDILLGKDDRKKVTISVMENVVLHGSFWIFSPEYFKVFNGLTEKNAMFMEEETLLYQLQSNGLSSLYIPDILVLHLGDQSTDAAYKTLRKKMVFSEQNRIESSREYLEMIHKEI